MADVTLKITVRSRPLLRLSVVGGDGRPKSWAQMGVWVGASPPSNPCTFEEWVANGAAGYWGWRQIT